MHYYSEISVLQGFPSPEVDVLGYMCAKNWVGVSQLWTRGKLILLTAIVVEERNRAC